MNLKPSVSVSSNVANSINNSLPASEVERLLQDVRDEFQAVNSMIDTLEGNIASCLCPAAPVEDSNSESARRTPSSNLGATLDGFYYSLVNIHSRLLDLSNRCQL